MNEQLPPLPPIDDYLPTDGPRWTTVNFIACVKRYATDYARAALAAKPCTCPSGDGSLRWPCPVHPAPAPEAKPEAQQAKPATCPHIGQCHPGFCPCHGIGASGEASNA